MSFLKLTWIVIAVFYALFLMIGVAVVLPNMTQNAELALRATSQREVAEVMQKITLAAPGVGVSDEVVIVMWSDLLSELSPSYKWHRFETTDRAGKVITRGASANTSWVAMLTSDWRNSGAKTAFTRDGMPIGFLSVTASTVETSKRLENIFIVTFALCAALLALQVFVLMRLEQWARKPLTGFFNQIQAISERQFFELEQPSVKEWIPLSRVLNVMVVRVRQMMDETDAALGSLTDKIAQDALTHTASRDAFMDALRKSLELPQSRGGALIVRVNDLEGMNRMHGRSYADEFLITVATTLRARMLVDGFGDEFLLARLNGADFGILLPESDSEIFQKQLARLAGALAKLSEDGLADSLQVAWVGGTAYLGGELLPGVLTRIDAMVMASEAENMPFCFAEPHAKQHLMAITKWRDLIENALDTGRLKMIFHPVVDGMSRILHREGMLRLVTSDGVVVEAGNFIPPAIRCGRVIDLDLKAVSLALAELRNTEQKVSVNIAVQSVRRPIFHRQLKVLIQDNADVAGRLMLEVREPRLAGDSLQIVNALCSTVSPFGVSVGLNHFGVNLTALHVVNCPDLSYVKLAARVLFDIENQPRVLAFVGVLTEFAQRSQLLVIASNVRSPQAFAHLKELGVGGFTGPSVIPKVS